jgi:hypothetical protein
MALTVKKTNDLVCRRLRYRNLPPEYPIVDVVNDAGWWLLGVHEWNWLAREPVSLDITAGQPYILLPTDLVSATEGVFALQSASRTFRPTSRQTLGRLSGDGVSQDQSCYYGAIVWPDTSLNSGSINPRIQLSEEPTETVLGAFTLVYRAGWKEVGSDGDHIVIPRWLERVFIEACVAHVGSAEQEARGSLAERLAQVMLMIPGVSNLDSAIQDDYGPVTGSAATQAVGSGYEWIGIETPSGPVYP